MTTSVGNNSQVPPEALAAHAALVKGKKEEIKALYSKQAEQELLQTVREFHTCKQEEGQYVSSYVLKMKGYIDNLERLGQPIGQNLAVSLILVSLNKDFDSFVQNYNIHCMGKTVNELHAMLKLHEETLPKKDANPALYAIRAGRVQKNQKYRSHKAAKGSHGKGKGNMGIAPNNAPFAPKPKTPPPPKKDNPAKNAIFHQCGCGIHICITTQGLRGRKKLKPGALSLYVGDGHHAAVEAIRTYHLELLSVLVIVLNSCHYAPSITRGVILVSRLFDDVFQKEVENQLRKTIKSVRSDRGERRNRKLLDMVRSMMSQTTLPKSFWDYDLETAARILNMVPTKKGKKSWLKNTRRRGEDKTAIITGGLTPPETKIGTAAAISLNTQRRVEQKRKGASLI
nr:hypothetical protein [Tanacetum cinerariifolium]